MDSVSRGAAWTINHGDAVAISSVFKQTKFCSFFLIFLIILGHQQRLMRRINVRRIDCMTFS